MKVYLQIFLAVFTFLLMVNLTIQFTSEKVLLAGFFRLETKQVQLNVQRVSNALREEIEQLGRAVSNESYWDPTYEYIQTPNDEFRDNMVVLVDLNLDFIIYLNSAGQVVFGKSLNAETKQEERLPVALSERILAHPSVWQHDSAKNYTEGLLQGPLGAVLLASRAILTSQEEGPARGTLIFGRVLDDKYINALAQRLGLVVKISSTIKDTSVSEVNGLVRPLSETVIQGTLPLQDLLDNNFLDLIVEGPRDIMLQGRETVAHFVKCIRGGSFLAGVVLCWVLVKWHVVRREKIFSEEKYKRLFKSLSVPIFEEDLTGVYSELEKLRSDGVTSLKRYLMADKKEVWRLLSRAKTMDVNLMAMKICMAKTELELIQSASKLVPAKGLKVALNLLCAIWAGKSYYRCETVCRTLVGEDIPVIMSLPIPKTTNEACSVPISVEDISGQKQNENSLKELSETKTLLLQEVNHRVTNNLSATLSMINAAKAETCALLCPPQCIKPFTDLKVKISNLLIVHKMLSTSQWQPLTLSALCENVIDQTLSGFESGQYRLTVDRSDVLLTGTNAHHLALVVGELALNSSKHFQTNSSKLQVKVSFDRKSDQVVVCYVDNGPGYPDANLHGDLTRGGKGLKMVQSIVNTNLGGELQLLNMSGATARIVFPTMERNSDVEEL